MIIVKSSSLVGVFHSVNVNVYKGNVYFTWFREVRQKSDLKPKYGHYKVERTKALDFLYSLTWLSKCRVHWVVLIKRDKWEAWLLCKSKTGVGVPSSNSGIFLLLHWENKENLIRSYFVLFNPEEGAQWLMTVSDLLAHSKRFLFSYSSGIRHSISPTREMSNT